MKTSGKKVKCMTCGNMHIARKPCPTCTGKIKETRTPTRRSPNNR